MALQVVAKSLLSRPRVAVESLGPLAIDPKGEESVLEELTQGKPWEGKRHHARPRANSTDRSKGESL